MMSLSAIPDLAHELHGQFMTEGHKYHLRDGIASSPGWCRVAKYVNDHFTRRPTLVAAPVSPANVAQQLYEAFMEAEVNAPPFSDISPGVRMGWLRTATYVLSNFARNEAARPKADLQPPAAPGL